MQDILIGKKYQHFKGNFYRILNVAKSSETLEDYVVYEALYENPQGRIWIRPKKMFLEVVSLNGKNIPRFKLVEE